MLQDLGFRACERMEIRWERAWGILRQLGSSIAVVLMDKILGWEQGDLRCSVDVCNSLTCYDSQEAGHDYRFWKI